jgi:hypothetical protein
VKTSTDTGRGGVTASTPNIHFYTLKYALYQLIPEFSEVDSARFSSLLAANCSLLAQTQKYRISLSVSLPGCCFGCKFFFMNE